MTTPNTRLQVMWNRLLAVVEEQGQQSCSLAQLGVGRLVEDGQRRERRNSVLDNTGIVHIVLGDTF